MLMINLFYKDFYRRVKVSLDLSELSALSSLKSRDRGHDPISKTNILMFLEKSNKYSSKG